MLGELACEGPGLLTTQPQQAVVGWQRDSVEQHYVLVLVVSPENIH